MFFEHYQTDGFYDEMFDQSGKARNHYKVLKDRIDTLEKGDIFRRQEAAVSTLFSLGITFSVYKDGANIDRVFPFDIIPLIINTSEWKTIESGLKQRIKALNLFLHDIYNDQKILKDKKIPSELILGSKGYLKQCVGLNPPKAIWNHITGTDIIRHSDGNFYVLEDNLRVPSGVSYVLENREIMKRTFPVLFETLKIRPVYKYPIFLRQMLQYLMPDRNIQIGVLTPGIYNSAYFEHSFLAKQMGVDLVEGRDLVVENDHVYMKTIRGLQKIDVLYRRIDDVFLDPLVFRPDSVLGVPGIMEAYRKGNVALANAPGTGVADDKAVYSYLPDIIKYYLGEEQILPNIPTYICSREKDKKYVLENIDKLVVKPTNESGGYGILIGPHATKKQLSEMKSRIMTDADNFIAQPVMQLSRIPSLIKNKPEGRHIDLRPFVIQGEDIHVLPGGLSRVALKKGSLIVNSSQGGGSKDIWVLENGV